jgi:hypothetical protein
MNYLSDGAPQQPDVPKYSNVTYTSKKINTVSKITGIITRLRPNEGPRGVSTRLGVMLRYISYFFSIVFFSSVTQYFTADVSNAKNGGLFMFLACTSVFFVGAIASLFYVNLRNEIVERVRHYSFGIILLPGSLIAVFMKAADNWLGTDTFGRTLGSAMPIVFLATVILPVFIFIKEMAGIRTLYRTKLDDQEQVSLWTRNDGLQR